ncbi:MAG TPA: hypothetical protein VKB80_21035 [Kofleriaceae bacterium]|nr:hypothetical protein [Kofleriaceae bacterium]
MSDRAAAGLDRLWTSGNLVALARMLLAAALLVLAFLGMPRAVAAVLVISLACGIAGERLAAGGRLSRWSSWARLAGSACLPLAAFWLRPDLPHVEAVTFWSLVAAIAAPFAAGFIKFGAIAGPGARAAVIASYLAGGAVALVAAGGSMWPLRAATALLAAAALEEIAVMALLPRPMPEVTSLPAALRLRRDRPADLEE